MSRKRLAKRMLLRWAHPTIQNDVSRQKMRSQVKGELFDCSLPIFQIRLAGSAKSGHRIHYLGGDCIKHDIIKCAASYPSVEPVSNRALAGAGSAGDQDCFAHNHSSIKSTIETRVYKLQQATYRQCFAKLVKGADGDGAGNSNLGTQITLRWLLFGC